MKDTDPFPFGVHKGEAMQDVPARYLDWLRDQPWIDQWPDVVAYIEDSRLEIDYEIEHGWDDA